MSQEPKSTSEFLEFRHRPYGSTAEDGSQMLNLYSSTLTNGHHFPGAQAMLYAAGVKNAEDMKTKPQVGMLTKHFELFFHWLTVCIRRCIGLVGRKSMQVSIQVFVNFTVKEC